MVTCLTAGPPEQEPQGPVPADASLLGPQQVPAFSSRPQPAPCAAEIPGRTQGAHGRRPRTGAWLHSRSGLVPPYAPVGTWTPGHRRKRCESVLVFRRFKSIGVCRVAFKE